VLSCSSPSNGLEELPTLLSVAPLNTLVDCHCLYGSMPLYAFTTHTPPTSTIYGCNAHTRARAYYDVRRDTFYRTL